MNTSQQYWKTNVILLRKAHNNWYALLNLTLHYLQQCNLRDHEL